MLFAENVKEFFALNKCVVMQNEIPIVDSNEDSVIALWGEGLSRLKLQLLNPFLAWSNNKLWRKCEFYCLRAST
jgi:hypothetical protein